jgi:hypothetical protein
VYDVQASSNLVDWSFVGDPFLGTANSSTAELIQSNTSGNNFFRLLVR